VRNRSAPRRRDERAGLERFGRSPDPPPLPQRGEGNGVPASGWMKYGCFAPAPFSAIRNSHRRRRARVASGTPSRTLACHAASRNAR
jgi:hypothetical protein